MSSPVGARFDLVYSDVYGVVTERVIEIQTVWLIAGAMVIQAHCFLRDEERYFRSDRILHINARGQKQKINTAQWRNFAVDSPRPDIETIDVTTSIHPTSWIGASEKRIQRRLGPGLKPLIWIMRADNSATHLLRPLVAGYVRDRTLWVKDAWDDDLIEGWVSSLRPTLADAAGALAKMAQAGVERPLVRDAAERMAAISVKCAKRLQQLRRSGLL